MSDSMKAAALSLVRSLLIVLGTYAAAKGWIGTGAVEAITGGVIAFIAATWGVADKLKKE